jgi:phospholipid/cholesterol/gamma-HCH transport system ATP-binding protein
MTTINPESMFFSPDYSTGKKFLIEIEDLCISFGRQEVLKNITLNLHAGENLVILGKSGSGKSVLIKCIVGLLHADEGLIKIFGKDIKELKTNEFYELRQKIGFLFQSGALYDSMTVEKNLEFPLKRASKKMKEEEIKEKVKVVLERVGLADTLHKMPSELSGGMRKRISIARTIIVDPLIMLYDEPTTGLDPITSDEISSLINEVQKTYKTSSIIITHDMRCTRKTSGRILMLKDGCVSDEGKYEDFEKSVDPFIKSFFEK